MMTQCTCTVAPNDKCASSRTIMCTLKRHSNKPFQIESHPDRSSQPSALRWFLVTQTSCAMFGRRRIEPFPSDATTGIGILKLHA